MTLDFDPIQTLAFAILVLYTGTFVISRVGFLRENNVPVPVVGGLLFAVLTAALYGALDIRPGFDMALKEPMMLVFFATIGLGADLKLLKQGGPRLLLFALICLAYLIVQDGIGIMTAMGLDLHPLVGLLSGSITLSGGHGTGVAYAQQFSDVSNLAGAMELAMACATFGLVLGGLIGGPVAGRLVRKHGLRPAPSSEYGPSGKDSEAAPQVAPIDGQHFLLSLLYVVICLIAGRALYALLSGAAFTLPSFVWCLLVGVVIRNVSGVHDRLHVHGQTMDLIGNLSLALFLAMALMSLQIWNLWSLAGPLLVLLGIQVIGMMFFATFVTFRAMGGNYDSAVIAGGHCGFGMGSTPTAVANMEALTSRYGHSPQAFLVVPLMGAFFIDVLNAIVIQGYLALPLFGY
ncbi:MAG: sodium/glutamate symporter [Pseudomonadota bacterium]|nr:sodium/glutamate symporter [Pseudomonadota bacterium]